MIVSCIVHAQNGITHAMNLAIKYGCLHIMRTYDKSLVVNTALHIKKINGIDSNLKSEGCFAVARESLTSLTKCSFHTSGTDKHLEFA